MSNRLDKILKESSFFTHGGGFGALTGIIATGCISSTDYLASQGDWVYKTTDPTNTYTAEDRTIFFESPVDRGKLSYRDFNAQNDPKISNSSFSFLVVADANTLLTQANAVGKSDGVMLARSDGNPLNIDLRKVRHCVMVLESDRPQIESYIQTLKNMGHSPFVDSIVFKTKNEIDALQNMTRGADIDSSVQHEVLKHLPLQAEVSFSEFNGTPKRQATKTSTIEMRVAPGVVLDDSFTSSPLKFENHHEVLAWAKSRPTSRNLAMTASFLMGLKKDYFSEPLQQIKNKINHPGVVDLANSPQDLAFVLNQWAAFKPSKGSEESPLRVGDWAIGEVKSAWRHLSCAPEVKQVLMEAMTLASKRVIDPQDIKEIQERVQKLSQEKSLGITKQEQGEWRVAVAGQLMPFTLDNHQLKEYVDQQPKGTVSLWKEGMPGFQAAEAVFTRPTQTQEVFKTYHVAVQGILQPGQMSELEILERMKGNPGIEYMVWREGMENWKNAKEVCGPRSSMKEFKPSSEPSFRVALNGILQPGEMREQELKEALAKNPYLDMDIWRPGMRQWEKAKDMFKPPSTEWKVFCHGQIQSFTVRDEQLHSWLQQNKNVTIHLWKPGMETWKKPEEMFEQALGRSGNPSDPPSRNKKSGLTL